MLSYIIFVLLETVKCKLLFNNKFNFVLHKSLAFTPSIEVPNVKVSISKECADLLFEYCNDNNYYGILYGSYLRNKKLLLIDFLYLERGHYLQILESNKRKDTDTLAKALQLNIVGLVYKYNFADDDNIPVGGREIILALNVSKSLDTPFVILTVGYRANGKHVMNVYLLDDATKTIIIAAEPIDLQDTICHNGKTNNQKYLSLNRYIYLNGSQPTKNIPTDLLVTCLPLLRHDNGIDKRLFPK